MMSFYGGLNFLKGRWIGHLWSVVGKKSHKKLRFIFIRNGKGQKDENIMREERGRRGLESRDRGNPVSNQASGGCRDETREKWASVPNCDKR